MKRITLATAVRKPEQFLVLLIRDRAPELAAQAIALEQARRKPRKRTIAKLQRIADAHAAGTLYQSDNYPNFQIIPP